MGKKLSIGVVPLIAAVALAAIPGAALAASPAHYFSGGLGNVSRIEGGERVPTIAWGTVSLTNLSTGAKVACHDVIGAVDENPPPGGEAGPAGISETQSYGAYDCEGEGCEEFSGFESVFAEGTQAPFPETGTGTMTAPNVSTEEPLAASGNDLKWKSELIEESAKVRQEIDKVKVNLICHVETGRNEKGEKEYEVQVPEVLKGNLKPLTITHCCTKGVPGELEFDPGSGTLENEKGQRQKLEGRLKTLGFDNQEIINVKQG